LLGTILHTGAGEDRIALVRCENHQSAGSLLTLRFMFPRMTRTGRVVSIVVVAATLVLEVIAYLIYRDATDAIFVNVGILLYAGIALAVVGCVDRLVRSHRRRCVASSS
jgi:hypothetical protein